MSAKGKAKPSELDETTLEKEDIATAQERVPVPYSAGTNLIAIRWISPALSMIAKQAKDEPPGKK